MDSYNNYKSLLEQCTDEKDKAILEAKCEVLYEVSIKDIGAWFRKAIDYILKILKDAWSKIKEFFKSKKTKMMEEEIKELKKDLQKAKAEKEDISNKSSVTFRQLVDTENELGKRTTERDLAFDWTTEIEKSFLNNKYLWFDIYDYIDDKDLETEPAAMFRYCDIKNNTINGNVDEVLDQLFIKNSANKHFSIIKKEITSSIGNNFAIYDDKKLIEFIDNELNEKMLNNSKDKIEEMVDRLELLSTGKQIGTCNHINYGYNKLLNNLKYDLSKFDDEFKRNKNSEKIQNYM